MKAIAMALMCGTMAHGQADPLTRASADPPRVLRTPEARCAKTDSIVTLESPEIARLAGFAFEVVGSRAVEGTILRNAELAYDGNRYAKLSSRADGVIAEVRRDLGAEVKAGEILAVIDSMELGGAKAELLQSAELLALWETNAAREREMLEKGAGNQRGLLEAETKLAEQRISVARATQRLRSLGLSESQIDHVRTVSDTGSQLEILAPFDGVVVERDAVVGEVVQPTKPLLAVADTRRMWAQIELRETDLAVVRAGQTVGIGIEGLSGRVFPGKVAWISTQMDPRTRTIKARAEIDNTSGLLRSGMFARAQVSVSERGEALVVPADSVQWEGCCNVVFAKRDETSFKPVAVTLGRRAGQGYEVLAGLQGGETVVTRGSYILKTEILKGSIGAGCCEVDHLAK